MTENSFHEDITRLNNAFRRKNALHDSHEIASKLYPCATAQQTETKESNPFKCLFVFDERKKKWEEKKSGHTQDIFLFSTTFCRLSEFERTNTG